jgi:flagella basal body P-ring formation protein FlgA
MGHRLFLCFALLFLAITTRADDAAHLDGIESPEALRSQVEAYLQDELNGEYMGVAPDDIEVTASNLDARLRLAKCATPLRQEITSPRPYGSNVSVKVNCDAPKPWTIYVPARVDTFAEVAVLARSLARGAVLAREDVVLRRMSTSQGGFGLILDPQQAIGKELKRRLEAGEPVRVSHIKAPQVIRKGDRVVLEASTSGVSVVTTGTALANGEVGEQIRIRNEKSERVVDAEVVAPGKARVAL